MWRRQLLVVTLAVRSSVAQWPAETPLESEVRDLVASVRDPRDAPLVLAVARFYRDRDHAPAWTTEHGWNGAGTQLRETLGDAASEGLAPEMYRVTWPAHGARHAASRADVMLSLAALRYATHRQMGIAPPGTAGRDPRAWYEPLRSDSLLRAWAGASAVGEAVQRVARRSPVLADLLGLLAHLHEQSARGDWVGVSHGPSLRRGDRGPRVRELRLALEQRRDLLPDTGETEAFDTSVAVAVARFQRRHGIPPDSVAGPRTLRALNVPLDTRLEQVRLSMERARWLPPVHGDRVVTVNLPEFRVTLRDQGAVRFEAAVVIGTRATPTPLFADTITQVVFNPVWTIPPSIIAAEIRPQVRRDPSYLIRHHMVRVDGGIQQQPGPWNALGQVVFNFPNRFNVYLHDTPAKALFAESERAFSHGCVRVEHPRVLAERLLASAGWTATRVDSVIATGRRTVIPLNEPVPIHITYHTAFIASDGSMHFRDDVYGRDALLQRALDAERRRPFPIRRRP